MAFKLKSALNFGQKGSFKMRSYNPLKQTKPPKKSTESAHGQLDDAEIEYQQDLKMYREKMKRDKQLKEFLIKERGFNQEDADRMIKDGAYTYKQMLDEMKRKDVPAEPSPLEQDDTQQKSPSGKTITQDDTQQKSPSGKLKRLQRNKKVVDGGMLPEITVSPNKQEGPIDKKNLPLQPGEMEGTYIFGRNYGDEDIPGKGEGFEPTGTKDEQFTARERINDLEERAGFLLDNDIPDLEGSTDPADIKKLKTLKQTAKRLQHEADIMRKRMKNERSAVKQTSQDDFEPAYPGADYSKEDIDKMTREEKEMKVIDYDPAYDPGEPEYIKRMKKKVRKDKRKARKKKRADRKEAKKIKKHRESWSPAFPGADHSQEELDQMTEAEKEAYYN